MMELIDHEIRCPFCFSGDFSPIRKVCSACKIKGPLLDRVGAAFDHFGPPATLVRCLKDGDQPYLAKGAAAFMAAQFLRMEWPSPDYLIPVPISRLHLLDRGYNQSFLISQELSHILHCPVLSCLQRKGGDLSQAGLSKMQRLQMKAHSISFKSKLDLADKTLLLIDDLMVTGTSLNRCAEALLQACPAKIFALVLCRFLD